MDDDVLGFIFGFAIAVVVVFVFQSASGCNRMDGYKDGQIDALTGKVKYHLVVNPDSTREWKEVGK